ncbi:MAG: T9SS type A sorting domain-containing protein [Candidatus Marinimicrobia bacterium]|nr:T9SS type A sorting domain-containing protein [Candidatus Neomarinimicrobiota bacterium]
MKNNKIFLAIVILLSFFSQLFSFQNNFKGIWQNEKCEAGVKNWVVVRVEFQEDNESVTSGNGKFLQDWEAGDTSYVLDPVPHNRQYFKSHLKAINHYWSTVTKGAYSVDTSNSQILPNTNNAYILSNQIRYYNPASDKDSVDYKLAEFVYDAIKLVSDAGDYPSNQSEFIIYHAGVGQDFDFSGMFDPTPYDMPSFYFDRNFLQQYLPADKYSELVSVGLEKGIVVPEMQNQLDINIGLHGTEILLTGYLIGLPALYDTETGRSKAGVFGLMDQGSNNANGLIPIKPSAFERILLGIQEPIILDESGEYDFCEDEIYQIPINSTESFLVEYRKNSGIFFDSLYSAKGYETYVEALNYVDSANIVNVNIDENGVVIGVDDYDLTLQTDGLLIWHLNNPFYEFNETSDNPNGNEIPMLRLEEADGGHDIGKNYGTLSGSVNNGWKWDMWFEGNEGYADNNSTSMRFTDTSNPNTRTFTNISSGVSLTNFQFAEDTISVTLNFSQSDKSSEPNTFYKGVAKITPFDNDCLFGVKDSSIIVKSNDKIYSLLNKNKIINPNKIYLYPFETGFVEVENGETETTIRAYNYVDSTLILSDSNDVNFVTDLKKISVTDSLILLLPIDSLKYPATFDFRNNIVDLWRLHSTIIPFYTPVNKYLPVNIFGNEYFTTDDKIVSIDGIYSHTFDFNIFAITNFNDTLIIADESGGYYFFEVNSENLSEKYASEIKIEKIIPVHLNDDGESEFVILGEYNDRRIFAILTHYGYFLNGFPIFKDYDEIRVVENDNEYIILAMNDAGELDEYSIDGIKISSRTGPANSNSFFVDNVDNENIIVSDGTVWITEYDSAYWGYGGMNLQNDNRKISIQNATTPSSDVLIRDGLIYNYPNPIENGKTKFRYFAVNAEEVEIYIYELTGKFVEKLSQIAKQNQINEVEWSVENLESGVYIARVKVSGSGETKEYFVKPAILK